MATVKYIGGMSTGYASILQDVIRHGDQVSPRGKTTYELTDVIIEMADVHDGLPTGTGRMLNPQIAALEALQLIAGTTRPELMFAAAPNFREYAEPGGFFWGAYGVRTDGQIQHVVRKLKDDIDTRQAIITLWDPVLDNEPGRKDYPCTIGMQFRIRDDRLDLSVCMRSNDVWKGLAYDAFQFTQLQLTVANVLSIDVGTYRHHALSLHIYESDVNKAEDVKAGIATHLEGLGDPNDPDEDVHAVIHAATDILDNKERDLVTWSEEWYIDRIQSVYTKMNNEG
jgi:thymidylate synthase